MLSYETNQKIQKKIQCQISHEVAGILWYEQKIEEKLQIVKNLDYFFNGLIFKNIKLENHKMDQLLITFSRSFNNPIFLVHFSNFENNFEKTRSFLKQFDHQILNKKILLLGNFRTFKEKLELSFDKTKFSRLEITL